MEKTRKNIDLRKDTIKTLTIEAIENGTVFKLYAESILENHANLIVLKKQKEAREKKKK